MDRVLISRYRELYKDSELKVDPFFIHKMGLLQKHTFLKLNDFFLYAIPTRLGFNGGQLLLSVSQREQSLIESLIGKNQQLRMRFDSPLFGKEMGLFVKVFIEKIQNPEATENFILVDLKFVSMPDDFQEILIELLLTRERLQKTWDEQQKDCPAVPTIFLQEAKIENTPKLVVAGQGKFLTLFKSLSLSSCELYISDALQKKLPNNGETITLEIVKENLLFSVSGTIGPETTDTHQKGVKIIDVALKFSPALTDSIIPLLELISTSRRKKHSAENIEIDSPIEDAETVQ